jgi:hypothetical protein
LHEMFPFESELLLFHRRNRAISLPKITNRAQPTRRRTI